MQAINMVRPNRCLRNRLPLPNGSPGPGVRTSKPVVPPVSDAKSRRQNKQSPAKKTSARHVSPAPTTHIGVASKASATLTTRTTRRKQNNLPAKLTPVRSPLLEDTASLGVNSKGSASPISRTSLGKQKKPQSKLAPTRNPTPEDTPGLGVASRGSGSSITCTSPKKQKKSPSKLTPMRNPLPEDTPRLGVASRGSGSSITHTSLRKQNKSPAKLAPVRTPLPADTSCLGVDSKDSASLITRNGRSKRTNAPAKLTSARRSSLQEDTPSLTVDSKDSASLITRTRCRKETNSPEKKTSLRRSSPVGTGVDSKDSTSLTIRRRGRKPSNSPTKITPVRSGVVGSASPSTHISHKEKNEQKTQKQRKFLQREQNSSSTKKTSVKIQKARKSISPKKHVQFQGLRSLRPRKSNKKYKDFVNSQSLDENDVEGELPDTQNDNLPVYKRPVKVPEKIKKDIYEFELCERSQSDSDNEYDRGIKEELKKIKRLDTKKEKLKLKRIVKKPPTQLKTKPINNKMPELTKQRKVNIISDVKIVKTKQLKQAARMVPQASDDRPNEHVKNMSQDLNEIAQICQSFLNDRTPPSPVVAKSALNITYSDFKKPDANSTFIPAVAASTPVSRNTTSDRTILPATSSPWRPHLVLRNGPHLLQMKKSSLPAFDQEMVLNSTIVEAHQPVFNCRLSAIPKGKTPPEGAASKKTKQTSILEYLPGASEANETDQGNCTLFDENFLLSPVKPANESPIKISKRPPGQSRVLRDVTNLMNTPEHDSTDVEFFALSATVENRPQGKPTRFVMKTPKKNDLKDVALAANVEQEGKADQADVETSVFASPESQTAVEEQPKEAEAKEIIGIFEDLDGENLSRRDLPSFTYVKKRKRVRIAESASDQSGSEDGKGSFESDGKGVKQKKRRRKRRNEMTQKEKQEMNKWAQSFNEMCDEIDQFELEVE